MFDLSQLVQDVDAGGDSTFVYDMGVRPTSGLLFEIRPLNDTGTLANFVSFLTACAALSSIKVTFDGAAIVQASGADLAALAWLRQGVLYPQAAHANTDNDRRSVILPVFFGRGAYDSECCLPAFQRGRYRVEVTTDDAATGFDDLHFRIHAIELPAAKPKWFERTLSMSKTFEGTGIRDFDLVASPVDMCRAALLWGTTGFTGASPAPSWGRVSALVDAVATRFKAVPWEVLHGMHALRGGGKQPASYDGHDHHMTANTDTVTIGGPVNVGANWYNYALLDFDPLGDDTGSIDLSSAKRFQLRAEDALADPVRVLQVNRNPVSVLEMTK